MLSKEVLFLIVQYSESFFVKIGMFKLKKMGSRQINNAGGATLERADVRTQSCILEFYASERQLLFYSSFNPLMHFNFAKILNVG